MKSPEEMEKSLHALMPAALSERGHQRISQKLRALALADEDHQCAEPTTAQSLAAVSLPPVSQALVNRMPWHTELSEQPVSSQPAISAPHKKSLVRWSAAAAIAIGSILAYVSTLSPAGSGMAKISPDLDSDDLSVVSSMDATPVLLFSSPIRSLMKARSQLLMARCCNSGNVACKRASAIGTLKPAT
jgi:hypothetical protein